MQEIINKNPEPNRDESKSGQFVQPSWIYPHMVGVPKNEEVTILDYWNLIIKRKWQILITIFLSGVLAVVLTFVLPKKYTSELTFMPMDSQSSKGGLASMASQLTSMPGIGSKLGSLTGQLGNNKNREFVNILKSRTLVQAIIMKYNLMPVLFEDQWDAEKQEFKYKFPKMFNPLPVIEDGVAKFNNKIASVESEKKTGLIKITVTMKDPVLSSTVANGMMLQLQEFINNNALTVEKRNRIFIEKELVESGKRILEAGKALNQFYSKYNISSVIPETTVEIGSYEELPKSEKDLMDKLFGSGMAGREEPLIKEMAKISKVPGNVYLSYLTLNRQLLTRAHALLTQQYELAKIEEAKEDMGFEIIDPARVMIRPSSPKLFLNLAVGLVGGAILAFSIAFLQEYIHRLKLKNK